MQKERINKITEALYSNSASVLKLKILQYVTLDELFDLALHPTERLAFRAAWSLEHVLLSGDREILLHNSEKTTRVYSTSNNWSVLRSFSKLMMEMLQLLDSKKLDEKTTEDILNKTFESLEDVGCPIAVRCNMYDILKLFAHQHSWIIQELKLRIQLDLDLNETPALRSRAIRVLKKLERVAQS